MPHFTYQLPDDFITNITNYCLMNDYQEIGRILQNCSLTYLVVGFAYSAGLRGDIWDKKAVDFTIGGSETDISYLKQQFDSLKRIISKKIDPEKTGFLVRKIDFEITYKPIEIVLPEEQEETFETLSKDIKDALNKDEPALALDRLHTYTTRYLRKICEKHNIAISNGKTNYPLHSLIGEIVKIYRKNNIIQSDFTERSLKSSISLFDKYNDIRNNNSYAHDNNILNKAESTYVVSIVSSTIAFIKSIEDGCKNNDGKD